MNSPTSSSNSGHRQRLRSKFLQAGTAGLHDYELLELLLTYAIPRRDVKPLAKELLRHFESINGLMNAKNEELCQVDGVGENAAALILLLKAFGSKYLEERIQKANLLQTPSEVIRFARMKIGGNAKETFMIIHLGSQDQLLAYDCFSEGTVNRVAIYQREVIELCLKRKTVAAILVHNHPSGFCEPSEEDFKLTGVLAGALRAVSIQLYDHIIVSPFGYHSMAAHKEIKGI